MPRKPMTFDVFIGRARKVHGDEYEYDEPSFIKADEKLRVKCSKHGWYEVNGNDHLRGSKCFKCSREARIKPFSVFEVQANLVHNNKYAYDQKSHTKAGTRMRICCPNHGWFMQTPNDHIRGRGCIKCAGHFQYGTEEFINKAKAVHGDRYDYSKAQYVNAKSKVQIGCYKHGFFYQTANSHLSGGGCGKCTGRNKTTEEFAQQSELVHGKRYQYHKTEYRLSHAKVTITCPTHGDFYQTPNDHLSGYGCANCAMARKNKHPDLLSEEDKLQPGVFYKLRFFAPNGNKFNKIGYTTTGIDERYRKHRRKGFSYDVIHITESTRYTCQMIEIDVMAQLGRLNKLFQVHDLKVVDGWTECYYPTEETESSINAIISQYID